MPKRPTATRRWLTTATWPIGVSLTSWDYMWRSTPMHRQETVERKTEGHLPPALPDGVDRTGVIGPGDGHGPLFHRLYRTRIRDAERSPEELFSLLSENLNRAAPTKFARFQKVRGDSDPLAVGDEYVVRMPGPWDGPVRVMAVTPRSFRLATLAGHLEAGQIEFRVGENGVTVFEIESWAKSATRLSNLLYHRARMAKEVQLHMWISFLEGVVSLSGGRMTGGIEIDTRRVTDRESGATEIGRSQVRLGAGASLSPRLRGKLAGLPAKSVNYDPARLDLGNPPGGWVVDDRRQRLADEPPGEPVHEGSFENAARLIRGYEFADPSIVRAFYEPGRPLAGRDMLLELRALGLARIYVGVRVGEVYDDVREVDGRPLRVYGWYYRTLEGHVEMGQMNWEVLKWLDSGEVEFHIHSVSRSAPISNLVVRMGFLLLRRHERRLFLDSTGRRMKQLTAAGLRGEGRAERIRSVSAELTVRWLSADDQSHEQLARQATETDLSS